MKQEDEFEGLLSEALGDVREAEPRVGLEGRVLAGVRASAGERRVARWRWVAVAAALVLMVVVLGVRRGAKNDVVVKTPVKVDEARPVESAKVPSEAVKQVVPVGASTSRNGQKHKRVESAKRDRQRKQEADAEPTLMAAARAPFPTPVPLTEEEKTLQRWAAARPQVMVKLNEEPKEAVENPITIRPLMTDPITGETK